MRETKTQTRRGVLRKMSGVSLAVMGTGVASAEESNQNENSGGRIIKQESKKPILEHLIEDYGMHEKVTLVTCRVDENGGVRKADESTIDLKAIDSVRQARNDESVVQKIPSHLRSDIKGIEKSAVQTSTGSESDVGTLEHGEHNTNYSVQKEGYDDNLKWKLTLYSTWNWDDEERVLDTPYGFTYGYTESDAYDWGGLRDSEATGLGTSEGHHRIEGKFSAITHTDKPYVEIGFKVRALSAQVEYKKADNTQ